LTIEQKTNELKKSEVSDIVDSTHAEEDKLAKLEQAEIAFQNPTTVLAKMKKTWTDLHMNYYMKSANYNFETLDPMTYHSEGIIGIEYRLHSPLLWTPLVQLVDPTEELLEFLHDCKLSAEEIKSKVIGTTDLKNEWTLFTKQLVRGFVNEVAQDAGFDVIEDFYCRPSWNCKFNGIADFMLIDREREHLNYGFPFAIVQVMPLSFNQGAGTIFHIPDLKVVGAMGQWGITRLRGMMDQDLEFKKRVQEDERLSNFRIIFTNGHIWQLYEFDINYHCRKTHWYTPRTVEELLKEVPRDQIFEHYSNKGEAKIWHDFRQQQIALGLIRLALNTPSHGEAALQETYDYLGESQYMEKMSERDKEVIRKRERIGRFLPRFLRRLYVGIDREPESKPSEREIHLKKK
jgi:hypothetical protein